MENAQQDDINSQVPVESCSLFKTWLNTSSFLANNSTYESVDGNPFQSILGISSLELAMKNNYQGDYYPFIKTHYDTEDQVETFLDLSQATAVAQFMIILILKLVMSPKLPLSAPDYGTDIQAGVLDFMGKYADNLDKHGIPVSSLYPMGQPTSFMSEVIETRDSWHTTFLDQSDFHSRLRTSRKLQKSSAKSPKSLITALT